MQASTVAMNPPAILPLAAAIPIAGTGNGKLPARGFNAVFSEEVAREARAPEADAAPPQSMLAGATPSSTTAVQPQTGVSLAKPGGKKTTSTDPLAGAGVPWPVIVVAQMPAGPVVTSPVVAAIPSDALPMMADAPKTAPDAERLQPAAVSGKSDSTDPVGSGNVDASAALPPQLAIDENEQTAVPVDNSVASQPVAQPAGESPTVPQGTLIAEPQAESSASGSKLAVEEANLAAQSGARTPERAPEMVLKAHTSPDLPAALPEIATQEQRSPDHSKAQVVTNTVSASMPDSRPVTAVDHETAATSTASADSTVESSGSAKRREAQRNQAPKTATKLSEASSNLLHAQNANELLTRDRVSPLGGSPKGESHPNHFGNLDAKTDPPRVTVVPALEAQDDDIETGCNDMPASGGQKPAMPVVSDSGALAKPTASDSIGPSSAPAGLNSIAAAQPQPAGSASVPKGNVSTHAGSEELTHPLANFNDDLDRDASSVTTAQISGNNRQSEIHLALQADQMGAVELHARVTGQQVGAAIVVEKKEAHAALAVELPALQSALNEKNLHVEHIWLTQGFSNGLDGQGADAFRDQERSNPQGTSRFTDTDSVSRHAMAAITDSETIFDDRGHLSVRA